MELEEKENMILDSDGDEDEAGFEEPADECRDLDQVKLDNIWIWWTTTLDLKSNACVLAISLVLRM